MVSTEEAKPAPGVAQAATAHEGLERVSDADALAAGLGPANAMVMLDGELARTLGLALQNAVARQQAAGTVTQAAVSAVCASLVALERLPGLSLASAGEVAP